jgi:hypothetical protein
MKLDLANTKANVKGIEKKYLTPHGADWGKLLIVLGVIIVLVGIIVPYKVYHSQPTKLVTTSSAKSSSGSGSICLQGCGSESTTTPSIATTSQSGSAAESTGSSTSGSGGSENQQNSASNQALNPAIQQQLFQLNCGNQAVAAGNTYSSALAQATAAYNTEMNLWTIEQSSPTNNTPEFVYYDDAVSDYNSIADPAWTTLNNLVNSLIAQGCNNVTPAPSEPVLGASN